MIHEKEAYVSSIRLLLLFLLLFTALAPSEELGAEEEEELLERLAYKYGTDKSKDDHKYLLSSPYISIEYQIMVFTSSSRAFCIAFFKDILISTPACSMRGDSILRT